ncbi:MULTISPECIES: VOC family protein [Rhodobacterales]|nr:VOC family protein [Phaeobacter gallaeciensis]MDE4140716.1 VOC family protein [Phaeobacter gallaeciensis]MDE4149161.1 VOC family protein [Phaeobacter gallaeciensis]MDE4153646.1 VOC family protein [Phaeobacter gallaeciensis]MDE4229036.1 VOC family protein [Phaeobacter gallaeciensis]MDE4258111.1 VOC family protein [Phaeobacter gallaeciensis]
MDLNQVLIEVQDFPESIEFYTKFGLRLIVSERGEYARFEMPSGSATFSIYQSGQIAVGNTVIYFEVDDVDQKFTELRERGIAFKGEPKDQTFRWRTAHLNDPSGNKLCLFHAGNERRFPPWRLSEKPVS